MTQTNTLTELLGEPRTAIISTWDVVPTAPLTLSLAGLKAETSSSITQSSTVHAVLMGPNSAYVVGGVGVFQAGFNECEERFIKIAAYNPPDLFNYSFPLWLERALEGYMRPKYLSDPFIWNYLNAVDAPDWEIAERVNETLNMVKQVRRVKDALEQRNLEKPHSWDEALKVVAECAPDALTRSLAATVELDA